MVEAFWMMSHGFVLLSSFPIFECHIGLVPLLSCFTNCLSTILFNIFFFYSFWLTCSTCFFHLNLHRVLFWQLNWNVETFDVHSVCVREHFFDGIRRKWVEMKRINLQLTIYDNTIVLLDFVHSYTYNAKLIARLMLRDQPLIDHISFSVKVAEKKEEEQNWSSSSSPLGRSI